MNAHKKLISILHLYNTQMGKLFKRNGSEMRYKAIEDALDEDGQGVLI